MTAVPSRSQDEANVAGRRGWTLDYARRTFGEDGLRRALAAMVAETEAGPAPPLPFVKRAAPEETRLLFGY
jgi:hypothetical protein